MNLARIVFVALIVAGTGATSWCQAEQRYAFVVGVEDYLPEFFRKLDYAEEDAIELSRHLESLGYHVIRMTGDEDNPERKPTDVATLLKAFDGRLKGIEKDDVLLIAMTGHGVQFSDEDKLSTGGRETYFCPERARLDDKSTLVPITKEILTRVNRCPAERKLVLIDACRNEVLSDAGSKSPRVIKLESVHENHRRLPRGMSVLFSCGSREKSWEHEQLGHSVFSNYVLEYLAGDASDDLYDRGEPNIDGLVSYVRLKTNRFVQDNITTSGQLPQLVGDRESWTIGLPEDGLIGVRAGDKWDRNGIGMEFCWCPPGSYQRGDYLRYDYADTVKKTRVRGTNTEIRAGFWIGKFEVTQGEWAQVLQEKAEDRLDTNSDYLAAKIGIRFPMSFVSQDDAQRFCRVLTKSESEAGRVPSDWAYRLPTQVEWEYACRAGTVTLTAFGDVLSSRDACFVGSWDSESVGVDGPDRAFEVGSFRPNKWGVHDMHGNVAEFCSDSHEHDFARVQRRWPAYRGGSFCDYGHQCQSGDPNGGAACVQTPENGTESGGSLIGFRIVLTKRSD